MNNFMGEKLPSKFCFAKIKISGALTANDHRLSIIIALIIIVLAWKEKGRKKEIKFCQYFLNMQIRIATWVV